MRQRQVSFAGRLIVLLAGMKDERKYLLVKSMIDYPSRESTAVDDNFLPLTVVVVPTISDEDEDDNR